VKCPHPVSYTHLDVYKRQIFWRPVGKQNLRVPLFRAVAGIGRHQIRGRDAARDADHRRVAPPALAFTRERPDRAGAVKQAGAVADDRPVARFAEIINARPQKLSRVGRVVAHGDPLRCV